jgi:aldose 1-epimerase
MPSGDNDTPDGRRAFAAELTRVVRQLASHPSIVMWVPFNEGWGQHEDERIVALLRELDPTRPINHASGWSDRGAGDVRDVHSYPGPAIPRPEPQRALVLGEFGGLGLAVGGHRWGDVGWSYASTQDTVRLGERYRGLLEVLRPFIARGLSAAVYTQTTDVESEINGVMTYDRAVVKLPAAAVAANRRLAGGEPDTVSTPSLRRDRFGFTPDGDAVDVYTLTNARGTEARVLTYGAIIQSLRTRDRNGRLDDIVLGHDRLEGYLQASPYFGAVVGRYANRIAGARFTLDGRTVTLAANDGPNHLHGGIRGFDRVVWGAEPFRTDRGVGITLRYVSRDGEEGYPGELEVSVRYELTDTDALEITYEAETDAATPVNLSQHTYFNLLGHGAGDVLGHRLMVRADMFTPVDSTLIPTGELAPVEGTPFDFRTPTPIGARIGAADEQLRRGRGYDHNFVVNTRASLADAPHVARVEEPVTGRTLDVFTSEPGLQFYSGNFLDGTITGKQGRAYRHRGGLCLETQHFPDSPNRPAFPTTILRPGERYWSRTVWQFGVVP